MSFYFQLAGKGRFMQGPENEKDSAAHMIAVSTLKPDLPETPPSPYLVFENQKDLSIIDLTQPYGRIELARHIAGIPIYRIALELLIDQILLKAENDAVRMKAVRAVFAPEDPPEAIKDSMTERYAFAGTLHFPVIASRTDAQLIDLYLQLYGAACPEHADIHIHLAAVFGGYPSRLAEKCDGILWRGVGWVRLDRIVYETDRMDHDPEVTFESYVVRGRAGAQALAVSDSQALLAAWISAERVQRELCADIDLVLTLPDIRRLPRWVRSDVFRVLEREAMKQVFAESLVKNFAEWPELRRNRNLAEPIEANAKGEVSALIQQLLNQTLSADARYAGAAGAFALAAERRWVEARTLLVK